MKFDMVVQEFGCPSLEVIRCAKMLCSPIYGVSNGYMVAKVTQQFEGFTKTDLVTLVNDGETWKVTQSINSYK